MHQNISTTSETSHPSATSAGSSSSLPTEQLLLLAKTHSDALAQFGARLMVTREVLHVLLSEMSTDQRNSVRRRFLLRVDDILSSCDGVALPMEYHAAQLDEINGYIRCMKA